MKVITDISLAYMASCIIPALLLFSSCTEAVMRSYT